MANDFSEDLAKVMESEDGQKAPFCLCVATLTGQV